MFHIKPDKSVSHSLVTLVLFLAVQASGVTLLSQNFGSDPVNYSLPGTSSPFRFYDGPRYWAKSDMPGLTVNPAITGADGPYLAAQNLNDEGFKDTFSTTNPAQIDFIMAAAGYSNLILSVALAGLPAAETANFIRAKTDNNGDGVYETTIFDFKGNDNSPYSNSVLGVLTASFKTFSNLVLPRPTAADGLLRLRFEIFNDTDSSNEAAGVDSVLITGTAVKLATAISTPANHATVATNVTITATAEDDGLITNVFFYGDAVLLGRDSIPPYRLVWTGAPPGDHAIKTVAWDDGGNAVTSDVVNVTVVPRQIAHVIVISVDGMGSEYVKPLLATGLTNELTTFKRFQAEGAGTLNARNDSDYGVTLPNHITMMTSRGVTGAAGHNWTGNDNPLSTDTIASNKGSYVASGFDVAHDNGLRTGLWSGKSKFSLFQQSYSATSGALDGTGADNGRDKIDYDKVLAEVLAPDLTADFTNQLAASPFNFVFFHYRDPDTTGHASGWSTDPASAFATTLKAVDTEIGKILQMVENNPELKGCTAVILTADHGGHDSTHGTGSGSNTNFLDFTIPFYAWGAGVKAGGDLYAMNPASRTAPDPTVNPPYTGSQPIRNGDAANLALDLLGLGAIPGSMIDSDQALMAAAAPVITDFTRSGDNQFAMGGITDIACALVTEKTTSLTPAPILWEPIQTSMVQAGSFTFTIPQDTNLQAFFRVRRQ